MAESGSNIGAVKLDLVARGADGEPAPDAVATLEVPLHAGVPVVTEHGTAEVAVTPDLSALGVTVRTEWLVTGEPSKSPTASPSFDDVMPYRYVFGRPGDGDRFGPPEQRARRFVAGVLEDDPTGWGGTLRLQSRVVTEGLWTDEAL